MTADGELIGDHRDRVEGIRIILRKRILVRNTADFSAAAVGRRRRRLSRWDDSDPVRGFCSRGRENQFSVLIHLHPVRLPRIDRIADNVGALIPEKMRGRYSSGY